VRVRQSPKLAGVSYDVRGPVLDEAERLAAAGADILRLNIGNPAAFGFAAPAEITEGIRAGLATAHGYGPSRGLPEACEAVARYHRGRGVADAAADRVWLGNGVSELIAMTLQALLADGDEVLVPAPDYPLWTATVTLCGGRPVHYRCDEGSGWLPDLADVRTKVTARTRALVVINPNNPTGAVYPVETVAGLAGVAREHGLLLLSDEIYDQILYDGAVHHPTAALAPDLLCLSYGGLSKAYLVAGYRAGWVLASGPTRAAREYLDGLTVLANLRLCPNMAGQLAIPPALDRCRDVAGLVLPGGRLHEQRDVAWRLLTGIPGVSCVRPQGALYAFPRLDPAVYPVDDDEALVLRFLREERVLLVPGRGFNWPRPDHLRVVTLPPAGQLADALGRLAAFLARVRAAAA
jgi:alanine-synthesizing transaminase